MDVLVESEISARIAEIHKREKERFKLMAPNDPLKGDVLSVKVPWRYKKVDCRVMGLTPVQAMKEGDEVWTAIEYCGTWTTGMFWKFTSIGAADNL